MLKKLLPVVLSLAAFLGGAAGGEMLRRDTPADATAGAGNEGAATTSGAKEPAPEPSPEAEATDHGPAPAPSSVTQGGGSEAHGTDKGQGPARTDAAWFKFPQQFFVPILHDGRLDSTMILALSVEMPAAARETVHAHEIKLRDALLRQLLIHANTGGFDGNFTSEAHMRKLRESLTTTARDVVPDIAAVLIGDIARQER